MVVFKDGEPIIVSDDYLAHHGIKGQRWGVRRFQNKDGSLTSAGKKKLKISEYRREQNQKHMEFERKDSRTKEMEAVDKKLMSLSDDDPQVEKLMDRYNTLEWDRYDAAKEKTAKYMVDKYGAEAVADVERRANKRDKAIGNGILLAAASVTVAGIIKASMNR